MPTYTAPVRDMTFLLDDVLQVDRYANLPGFSDAPKDLRDAVLEESAKFCEQVLQPLNRIGDEKGCTRNDDGSVTTPPGFKEAFEQLREAGWSGLAADPEYGGQGLPHIMRAAYQEMASSANMAFGMYPGLTMGAFEAIRQGGSEDQKKTYLPKMSSCEWTGTMCLTEPHCGTDLGMLKSKAVAQDDGSYTITGQKIFISSGEHDLTDNIIHLVLARIEGAPEGTKGISLFIVPKHVLNADGSPGERNGVTCGSIEEKMGIHGNSTAVLNFDDATGYLIGEENRGLRVMFVMMNEARLGVGIQGLAQSEAAYQNAAVYARERIQGRSLTGPKNTDGPADPILVHPDVRRMLMDARAFNEGARAFILWTALQGDFLERSPDEKVREKADDYMALLTPVIKGYLTDKGYQNCTNAQQVFGGHGYVEEWGMSQFVRDARIAMIYEGANGVQALDLVGRKLAKDGGRPVMTFFAELDEFIADNEGDENLKPFVDGLKSAKERLSAATNWMMENGLKNFDNAGAGSTDYMYLFGLTALAYMWAMMAKAAHAGLANGADDEAFLKNKLVTGRYFVDRMLPDTAAHLAKVEAGADSLMALDAEAF